MLNKEGIAELRERLSRIHEETIWFFDKAKQHWEGDVTGREGLFELIGKESDTLRSRVKQLSVDIAGAARGSPLIAEVDFHDLRYNTRRILASLHIREYRYEGIYIHHDEGSFIGADPPSQEEVVVSIDDARQLFEQAISKVDDLIDLLSPAETSHSVATGTATYRPNTAFIMMAIDKKRPELEDTKNTIIEVCKEFGITAVTADGIEHEGAITGRILEEIETNEFLIADLTHERPNVYYEIGYAHAHNKRVILYCRAGTKVHFDVAHRNCPPYENLTDLKEQLRKRLSVVTNKPTKK